MKELIQKIRSGEDGFVLREEITYNKQSGISEYFFTIKLHGCAKIQGDISEDEAQQDVILESFLENLIIEKKLNEIITTMEQENFAEMIYYDQSELDKIIESLKSITT